MSRRPQWRAQGVPGPYSTQTKFKLRYVQSAPLTCTTGVLQSYVFRANSIFDPDLTGTGTQPCGRDQLALIWDHYVVLGAKITVTFSQDASQSAANIVGVHLKDSSTTAYGTVEEYMMAGAGKWKTLNGVQTTPKTMSQNFSCRKFFNLKDPSDNVTRVGATFGNNPTDDAYFHVMLQSTGASAATTVVNALVQIDYIVQCSEPKAQAMS